MAVPQGLVSLCAPLPVSYTLPCLLTTDFSSLVRRPLCTLRGVSGKKKGEKKIRESTALIFCLKVFSAVVVKYLIFFLSSALTYVIFQKFDKNLALDS
jgi:hypothetical protein